MYTSVRRNSSARGRAIKRGLSTTIHETSEISAGDVGRQQVRAKITHFVLYSPKTDVYVDGQPVGNSRLSININISLGTLGEGVT